jgi:hypothetical protein
MAAKRPLADYPSSIGVQMFSIFPHIGPTSYTQVTIIPGTVPATGGDVVTALAEAGFKWFDRLDGGVSDDFAWKVTAFPLTVTNPSTGVLSGIPHKTYGLQWIANKSATMGGQAQTAGSEAVAGTNLSTYCVRLLGIGPK